MPVGDISLPKTIYPIQGIRIGVTQAGVRYQNRNDLVIFALDEGVKTALVTTKNAFCAAPVLVSRAHFQADQGLPKFLLINTGNANAATGEVGLQDAKQTCQALADRQNVQPEAVLPFSTGVIGERLNTQAIIAGLDLALADLSAENWFKGADGIRTTDIIPKVASVQVCTEKATYHITGIAKGSGMIHPNMATMLGFVATDANIDPSLLQAVLNELTDLSFNRISVDGDTSTNDCCVLMATGKAAQASLIADRNHPDFAPLFTALQQVFIRLAQLIVRDGEGASKFVTIKVNQGKTDQECLDIGYAIAQSPLVKTALFASDPNWGRIVAAVGNAGITDLDLTQLSLTINGVLIFEKGGIAPNYQESQASTAMAESDILIQIDLGRGQASQSVYTCDLSYDYIKINADYRS